MLMKPTIRPMSATNDRYIGTLLEEIREQNKALLEGMKELPTRGEFHELRQDVTELKQDMKQITDHEHRITRFEAA